MLKVSSFYLGNQKSFIPKKIFIRLQSLVMPRQFQNMVLAVQIFSEGFGIGDFILYFAYVRYKKLQLRPTVGLFLFLLQNTHKFTFLLSLFGYHAVWFMANYKILYDFDELTIYIFFCFFAFGRKTRNNSMPTVMELHRAESTGRK